MEKKDKILVSFGFLLILFLTIVLIFFSAYKIIMIYHDFTYALLSVFGALGVSVVAYLLLLREYIE
jgi:hypothetical protein